MKIFVSGDRYGWELPYEETEAVEDADVVLILPGGLASFYNLFHAVELGKKTIVHNKGMYYSSLFKNLYEGYEGGFISKIPAEYLIIESEKKIIEKELEEFNNEQTNDGKIGKLL